MGERVTVVRDERGRLVAAKGPGPGGEEDLLAEAAVLGRVRMPGVVDLVGVEDGPPPLLVTRWVGSRSLADLDPPVPAGQTAALCLAVAATLGELHRLGVVHGAVEPHHVLLDPHGRPVLCGFGAAGSIGAPVRRPATDPSPAGATGPGRRPADDVAGLGRLLTHLLGEVGSDTARRTTPAPRRPGRGRVGSRAEGARRRALLAVARQATGPDPSCRPSLAAMAHAVRRAVPDATLGGPAPDTDGRDGTGRDGTGRRSGGPSPGGPGGSRVAMPDDHDAVLAQLAGISQGSGPATRISAGGPGTGAAPTSGQPPDRRSWLSAVAAVLAVGAATYFGLSAWWSSPTGSSPLPPPTTAGAPDGARADRPDAAAGPSSTADTTTPPPEGDPPVVEHEGQRYVVGLPGDVVAVGPWHCDGADVLALLRPAHGSVHVFAGWAPTGASTRAEAAAVLDGARVLDRVPDIDGDGCDDLRVGADDGRTLVLTAADLR